MKINDISTTNKLLMFFAVPLVFYILRELNFIFAPLMFAFFITLLFMPLTRFLLRRNYPRYVAIGLVFLIIIISSVVIFGVIKLSGQEILLGKETLYARLDAKVGELLIPYAKLIGIEIDAQMGTIRSILFSKQVTDTVYMNVGQTVGLARKTLTFILLTFFFLVLLLAGSLNLENMLSQTIFKSRMKSVKTYMIIEHSIVKFLKVKFFVSLLTGISFGLVCWSFGLSFPLFWGVFAFFLNFIQMIGSLVVTLLAAVFAFIEIEHPGTALLVGLLLTSVQLLLGSVLEPVLMGKSFRINIIAVLIMLMFWGYMWGIPGVVLSIPITVLIKTILEQFESTKVLARLMS